LTRPRAARAHIDGSRLWVGLEDGREISVPIAWFDWLSAASSEQQGDLRIIEGGLGVWWEQLEDGVSVPWLLGLPEWP
jgi:hypothetical protein